MPKRGFLLKACTEQCTSCAGSQGRWRAAVQAVQAVQQAVRVGQSATGLFHVSSAWHSIRCDKPRKWAAAATVSVLSSRAKRIIEVMSGCATPCDVVLLTLRGEPVATVSSSSPLAYSEPERWIFSFSQACTFMAPKQPGMLVSTCHVALVLSYMHMSPRSIGSRSCRPPHDTSCCQGHSHAPGSCCPAALARNASIK